MYIHVATGDDLLFYSADTPPECLKFMHRFDVGLPVAPFTIEIEFKEI